MRGISTYVLASIFTALALDIVAPPLGYGFSLSAWPNLQVSDVETSVNRVTKSDRLSTETPSEGFVTVIAKQPVNTVSTQSTKPEKMLTGCEPSFSPLSVSAYANFARRCAT